MAKQQVLGKEDEISKIAALECTHDGCDKTFRRPCDYRKHEKTHTRPFACSYHDCDKRFCSDKDLERHVKETHTANPNMQRCHFCEFSSKRESNLQQHMEKKHGYKYRRVKGGRKVDTDTTVDLQATRPRLGSLLYNFDSQGGSSCFHNPPNHHSAGNATTTTYLPTDDGFEVLLQMYQNTMVNGTRLFKLVGRSDYLKQEVNVRKRFSPVLSTPLETDCSQDIRRRLAYLEYEQLLPTEMPTNDYPSMLERTHGIRQTCGKSSFATVATLNSIMPNQRRPPLPRCLTSAPSKPPSVAVSTHSQSLLSRPIHTYRSSEVLVQRGEEQNFTTLCHPGSTCVNGAVDNPIPDVETRNESPVRQVVANQPTKIDRWPKSKPKRKAHPRSSPMPNLAMDKADVRTPSKRMKSRTKTDERVDEECDLTDSDTIVVIRK